MKLTILAAALLLVSVANAAEPVGGASAPMLSEQEDPANIGAEAPHTDDDPFATEEDLADEDPEEQAAIRAALARPASNPAPVHAELTEVFKQFGGEPGLTALMDDFTARLLADPRTKAFFENADQAKVKRHLVEQFCAVLGGGCAYTGRDMVRAHAGLGIGRSQVNALVEVLQDAMNARGIPFRAQNKLLAVLAPMHREIEEK